MKRKRANRVKKATNNPQPIIILSVLVLIAAVFIFKNQKPTSATVDSQEQMDAVPTADENMPDQTDVTLATAAIATVTPVKGTPSPPPSLLPEAQLDQYLAAGRPILAFFHSNTCAQCIQMTEIVNQVYPNYAKHIALVDVDVYDQQNRNLLSRAGIRVIPTLIFIDKEQRGEGYTGVMPAEALREQLETLTQEP